MTPQTRRFFLRPTISKRCLSSDKAKPRGLPEEAAAERPATRTGTEIRAVKTGAVRGITEPATTSVMLLKV